MAYILLLQFSYDHDLRILDKIERPQIIKQNSIMELSENAIQQLNLVQNNQWGVSGKNSSLFNVLDSTSTIVGKRLLKYRLLNSYKIVKFLRIDILK